MTRDRIGIGFVGHGWMGRVHTNAIAALNQLRVLPARLELVAVCGRDAARTQAAARSLGFARATTDWRTLVEDPAVDVVANVAVEAAHVEPTLAALAAGKSVLCEKPLALTTEEARRMEAAAEVAGVTAVCGYNCRFVPAIAFARQLVGEGRIGRPLSFRGSYLLDPGVRSDEERAPDPSRSGVIAGLSHVLDLMTVLAGPPTAVIAETVKYARASGERRSRFGIPLHEEDAYAAVFQLAGGALGTVSCTSHAPDSPVRQTFELEGTDGALRWDQRDLNRLQVSTRREQEEPMSGFRDVLVTDPAHPFLDLWWPPGHVLGWDHTFVHQWLVFARAVLVGEPVGVGQASFAESADIVAVCDAIAGAAVDGRRHTLDMPGSSKAHPNEAYARR